MDVRGLHHVAVAVDDLDEALGAYERLFGAELELRGRLDDQGVEAAYLRVGAGRVELLAALGSDTPVGRFLERRGPGMHHLAFEVADVAGALAHLERHGATLVDERPRVGFGGKEVAFVHPESLHGVLAEVVASDGD